MKVTNRTTVVMLAVTLGGEGREKRQKYYVDGGQVEIAAHLVYELDPNGKQLRVVKYTDYTAARVRTLFPNAAELRKKWADPHLPQRDHRGPG